VFLAALVRTALEVFVACVLVFAGHNDDNAKDDKGEK
jgi:hypothetical protein